VRLPPVHLLSHRLRALGATKRINPGCRDAGANGTLTA